MKKLLFIFIAICGCNIAIAKNIRNITNYKHNAQINFANNNAIIKVDGVEKSFATAIKNNLIEITQANDAIAFLQLDPTQQTSLKTQYDSINNGKLKGLHLANQIINRARELNGMEFANSNSSNLQVVDDANNTAENVAIPTPENTDYIEAKPQQNVFAKIWPWLLGILGTFIFAFFLGKSFNKQDANVIDVQEDFAPLAQIQDANNTANKVSKKQTTIKELRELDKQKTAALKQLQTENANLKTQHNTALHDLQSVQSKQQAISEAIQRKLVAPYIQAVEENNANKILQSALSGMANLTSIARDSKGAKQEYDVYNLQTILGDANLNKNQSKEINAQTNADDIPKNIKTIMELLRKNNIESMDNTSFFGYTIKKV